MRILHTGDMHLDSAFCAYGAKDAEKQREAGRRLLARVFECAKSEACQLILFAGDIFDGKFVTPETAELFCKLVEDCQIPVVISPGNHDFYSDNSFFAKVQKTLGEKLILFTSPELQVFDLDDLGVRLFGYAFTSAALPQSPLADANIPEDNGYLKILCAHADLASPVSRYAPLTLADIQKFDFDYAALGHIHNNSQALSLPENIRYCGFPEGRGFDEFGDGGVLLIDVDRSGLECTRVVLSQRAFYELSLELKDVDTYEEIKSLICETIKKEKYSSAAHVRLTLSGDRDGAALELARMAKEVSDETGIAYLEIYDETLPVANGEYLLSDTTLRGEFYRTLLPKLSSEDAQQRRMAINALRIGLAAIDGRSIFGFEE